MTVANAVERFEQHSIRAELHQRSDVDVVGSKVDTRTEAQASIRKRFDTLSILLRNLFADYDKCQRDNAGVGIEVKFQMDALMEGAYKAWLTENGGRAEGPGEAPVPPITEDNR